MKIISNKEYENIKLKQDNNELNIQVLEKRIEEISGANKCYKLENRRLRKRLDKSIEYIETKISDKKGVVVLPDLLNILRGKENE